MGIPAGGFKGDQDLDDGQRAGRGLQLPSWGWIQTKVTMKGVGGLAHAPPGPFHADISRTSPNPGEMGGGRAGKVPTGQLGKTGQGEKWGDESLINRVLSVFRKQV